jgi:hypothetical protein
MAITSVNRSGLRQLDREELRDERQHVRDLIFVRDLLTARGATPSDLRIYDRVINDARGRLAELAKRPSSAYPAAA